MKRLFFTSLLVLLGTFCWAQKDALSSSKVFKSLESALLTPDSVVKLDLSKKKLTEFYLDIMYAIETAYTVQNISLKHDSDR